MNIDEFERESNGDRICTAQSAESVQPSRPKSQMPQTMIGFNSGTSVPTLSFSGVTVDGLSRSISTSLESILSRRSSIDSQNSNITTEKSLSGRPTRSSTMVPADLSGLYTANEKVHGEQTDWRQGMKNGTQMSNPT